MPLSPFGHSKQKARPKIVRSKRPVPDDKTLDDFSGGLNLVDDDIAINTSFAVVLNNANRNLDKTMEWRWGTKYKWNWSAVATGLVIDFMYFRDKLIIFTTTGQILTITDAGAMQLIWSSSIAALLPGAPGGWSAGLATINWSEFRNELVVCNGVDKPILISKTHSVTYLQDLATGSNVNTPIARFVTTVGNFTVFAGVAATIDTLYISSSGTSGTWPGDAAPNDAVSINIAAYTAKTGSDLRGLSSFRNYLIVHFASASIMIVLGEYATAVHKPRVTDALADQGIISHRTQTVLDKDILFADERAVYKAKRNVFGEALETTKMSERVQTDFIASVPVIDANRQKSFSVHIKHENRVAYFLFNGTTYEMFTVSFDEELKKRAWSKITGWDFQAGCKTAKDRVFFAKDTRIYQYGNNVFPGESYMADFIDEYDSNWATATAYVVGDRVLQDGVVYIALAAHNSNIFSDDLAGLLWETYTGENIDVDWELPWTSVRTRMKKKRLSAMMFDSTGTAQFTCEIYIDRVRYDEDGLDDPLISMEMVAGDSPGYGGGDQPYGGGRRTADERLWGTPCEFKQMKLRFKSSTKKHLRMSAIHLALAQGTFAR